VLTLTSSHRAIPAVPVPQVDEIEAWAITEAIWRKFQILPPDNEYRFVNLAPEDPKEKFHTRKLFLGQNPGYKTWALIKMLKGTKRATQVVFQNVESDTSRTFVKELDELAHMCPFRVFKKKGTGVSFRHLQHFAQYVFLVAGEVDKVCQDDQAHSRILLSGAMDLIYDTYQIRGMITIHVSTNF
jgi:hypothetical protein